MRFVTPITSACGKYHKVGDVFSLIDLMKEEHMTATHKKAAQILKHWNLDRETIADIYYDGTGNRNDSACYVGEEYVLKFTANLGKLKNHIWLTVIA